jgi:hypothetical protein
MTKMSGSWQADKLSMYRDYVGGPLTVAPFARPLLKEDKPSSHLTFNCLLNPPVFKSNEQFQAEYLLMDDTARIADHFNMIRRPREDDDDDDAAADEQVQQIKELLEDLPASRRRQILASLPPLERVKVEAIMGGASAIGAAPGPFPARHVREPLREGRLLYLETCSPQAAASASEQAHASVSHGDLAACAPPQDLPAVSQTAT